MDWINFIPWALFLLNILLNVTIGFAAYFQEPTSTRHRLLLVFTVTLSLWLTANFIVDEPISQGSMIAAGYADFALAPFMMLGLFLLSRHIDPHKAHRMDLIDTFAALWAFLLSLAILFTRWIVAGIYITPEGISDVILTDASVVYDLTVFGYMLAAIFFLMRWLRHAQAEERKQAVSILLGVLVAFGGVIAVNVVLPSFLPYSKEFVTYTRLGNFSFLFVVLTFGYAIFKQHFLRVRLITSELIVIVIIAVLALDVVTARDLLEGAVRSLFTVVIAILGWILIGSITREAKQRSQISALVAELHEKNTKLETLDRAKTEFLSIASHQLRTPLSVIRGYIAMMQEASYGKLSKAQMDVVGKVRTSAETLIELVNHLLNVSRIESGRITVVVEPVNLSKICVDVSGFLSLKAKQQQLTLNCQKKKVPSVAGDESKVKEVVMNLVENALKYTEKGGVSVKFFDESKTVRVEVRDTGRGLTKEDLEKLFQKFSRGSAAAHNRVSGTGLGLYVCKRLVEAMGGEIWAESPGQGKGSLFAFRLKKAKKS